VLLTRFFFAITRYFLMLWVFVGLFWGQRARHWGGGGGGRFCKKCPIYPPKKQPKKGIFLGSEILFLATGAARDRPRTGLGFGLAARG
jgi:hypothetical protein